MNDAIAGPEMRLALITPVRNEEAHLEQTLRSVGQQSVRPVKWVIVSDGSTDRTNAIIQRFAALHDWIEPVFLPMRTERHFAAKVKAFEAGYEKLQKADFDIVGNLDGDISFDDPELFTYLLRKFSEDAQLGVAGVPYQEGGVQYDYRFSRKEHVSGACQLFRRECFEAIGGYLPLKTGAIDLVAVVTARMKGWRTETFPEKYCLHHRPMGTATHDVFSATFKSGYGDYRMGVDPIWQLFRSIYQMSRKPRVVGGLLLLLGYVSAMIVRAPKPVSPEFVQFRRVEQRRWLTIYLRQLWSWLRGAAKNENLNSATQQNKPA